MNVLSKDWVFRLGYRPYFLFFDETIIVEKFEKGKSYHSANVYRQGVTERHTYKWKEKKLINPFYRVLSETQEIPKIIASFFLVQLFTYYFD